MRAGSGRFGALKSPSTLMFALLLASLFALAAPGSVLSPAGWVPEAARRTQTSGVAPNVSNETQGTARRVRTVVMVFPIPRYVPVA